MRQPLARYLPLGALALVLATTAAAAGVGYLEESSEVAYEATSGPVRTALLSGGGPTLPNPERGVHSFYFTRAV